MEPKISKPITCEGCPSSGRGFTAPEGLGTRGVLMVGGMPGDHEIRAGLPFRPESRAGSILERAIRKCGYTRQEFTLTTVVRCQPNNDPLSHAGYPVGAIDHCRKHLDQVIEQARPKVILVLGDTALRALTGLAGEQRTVSMLRGYVMDSIISPDVVVVPTFDPVFLGRGGKGRDRETGANRW